MPFYRCILFFLPFLILLSSCSKEPNVIVITIDTLRSDYLHCYGDDNISTPYIDSLANDGVLFENSFSTFNLTSPSHDSILTGLYAKRHGAYINEHKISDEIITLPEVLREKGYNTVAANSVFHLNNKICRLGQGFDTFFEPTGKQRIAKETLIPIMHWIQKNHSRPFFMWLHFFDPHAIYEPPPPYDTLYYKGMKSDPDKPSIFTTKSFFKIFPFIKIFKSWLSPVTDIYYPTSQYMGEISYTDKQIGRLFSLLKKLGIYENTLIVLTSDHGESLGENNVYYDHWGLSDANYKVPLILKFPGSRYRSIRPNGLVQGIDIYPTVLDVLGYSSPAKIDGKSLLPLVTGEKESLREAVFFESTLNTAAVIRTERWKFALPFKKKIFYKNVKECNYYYFSKYGVSYC